MENGMDFYIVWEVEFIGIRANDSLNGKRAKLLPVQFPGVLGGS
jgi:hypothetical protein